MRTECCSHRSRADSRPIAWVLALWLSTFCARAVHAQSPEDSLSAPPEPERVAPAVQATPGDPVAPESTAVQPASAPAVDVDSSLEQARVLMTSLEYEKAIAVLEPVLEATRFNPDRLRETYLLLIEAHVYGGNRSAIGSKEQQLWYDEARDLIRECLGVRELRHTLPEPPENYPTEMLGLFESVRRETFGAFEITQLEPRDAEVVFDGQTVVAGDDGVWRVANVPVGVRMLVIRKPGYEDFTEDVEIAPATLVSRPYALHKKKGFGWYATRVAAPVIVAVGVVVGLAAGGDEPAAVEEPLPVPPLPPSK